MTDAPVCYTAITFAPVQGFIEKSRKLRDLYGSSFILSYLARAICDAATRSLRHPNNPTPVISPALINVTQGTPNQIIVRGNFPETAARDALWQAWTAVVEACRAEVERRLPANYTWGRAWNAWSNHAWEFFWAQSPPGGTITDARRRLNEQKRSRAWTGINWNGESSTLSGADAIAWYGMADRMHPTTDSIANQMQQIRAYCQQLSAALPHSIVDDTEQLSIPELIKRVLLLDPVVEQLNQRAAQGQIPAIEKPRSFVELNRFEEERWTGWFQGDGDGIGHFLKSLVDQGEDEAIALNQFSQAMMNWGKDFSTGFSQDKGRIIYAGGDDFLGVLYRISAPPLTGKECLDWFYEFPQLWAQHGQTDSTGKLLTVSVGFVWAAPGVPQRDVLQHCRAAEKAAKDNGRDRLTIRVVFNGGNTLEWICPWWFLLVLQDYRDRDHHRGAAANWGHIFDDVAMLKARHAFSDRAVALALFEIYFGEPNRQCLERSLWDQDGQTGILGNQPDPQHSIDKSLTAWICDLARIGFHLHRSQHSSSRSLPTAA
jgi:CRISPR-associated protein Cmr2